MPGLTNRRAGSNPARDVLALAPCEGLTVATDVQVYFVEIRKVPGILADWMWSAGFWRVLVQRLKRAIDRESACAEEFFEGKL